MRLSVPGFESRPPMWSGRIIISRQVRVRQELSEPRAPVDRQPLSGMGFTLAANTTRVSYLGSTPRARTEVSLLDLKVYAYTCAPRARGRKLLK
jgi:hypothetical protein